MKRRNAHPSPQIEHRIGRHDRCPMVCYQRAHYENLVSTYNGRYDKEIADCAVAGERQASKGQRSVQYGREVVEPHVRSAGWQRFRVETAAAYGVPRFTR